MATEIINEMMPVRRTIERDTMADKNSESYRKRKIDYPDEVTFHLYDNNNPGRTDMSHNSPILLQRGHEHVTEEGWRKHVGHITYDLDKPEFRRANNLSDFLEIVVYREEYVSFVELIYEEMEVAKFEDEYEKHEKQTAVARARGILIGGKIVVNPFPWLWRRKKIVYRSENRTLLLVDLRPPPPGWGAMTYPGPIPPEHTRRTSPLKRKKTDEDTDEE